MSPKSLRDHITTDGSGQLWSASRVCIVAVGQDSRPKNFIG
jgi:hypothetical protein